MRALVLISVAVLCSGDNYELPAYFEFGVASSAYQSEGAWNVSGKGENIWDRFTHNMPWKIQDHSNGDVACDVYHKWSSGVELLKHLNVNFFRFSLSWSRLLPTGFTNEVNRDGVRYYNNIINDLVKNNIEPMVTIFHWDVPMPIQELGGLANPAFVDYFTDFARLAFTLFGDRVKLWITFNEPLTYCLYGYETAAFAPGISSPGVGCYLCGKSLLLAHARAYHLYNKEFRQKQGGKVSIAINAYWYEPKTKSASDIEAVSRALDFNFGWWMHPIFSKKGNYPEAMIKRVDYFSKAQNFTKSRLPSFTEKEVNYMIGTADFLGLNYYTGRLVEADLSHPSNPPSFYKDAGVLDKPIPGAQKTASDWLQIYPVGLRKVLMYVKKKYNNPLVYITENGCSTAETLNDDIRIHYIAEHLVECVKAIESGCNLKGYTHWSFLDNFEWTSGYKARFGLYLVDFNSPNKTRTPKKSAHYFRNVIKTRNVFANYTV